MVTVHGLKNCDTCRKALKWLAAEGIDHQFRDVRADGVDAATLAGWSDAVGWEALLNRRGTTWRKLPESEREDVGATKAVALMEAHPALIKRPVFDVGGRVLVGFSDTVRTELKAAL